jgi:8-oxo-dGTP pyrophosphatase MutT (NUDIX family)
MVWKPDVTVAAIIERSGRFLLVEERIRGRLVLNQPAGHLEDGEALLDAVIRETLEETAWQFTPEALLGVYQWRSARGHTTLRFAFTGTVQGYDAGRPLDPPIVTTHWLAPEEIA